ncbi:MAG: hypothetical protein JSS62_00405 [Verrucomicrobia bacterium]|nr:hypothetical protein [Verrucomicrobiota bacterium]MBS0646595.1 hypothetical protein [Verrucomicrobiota bacterium]
MNAAQWIKLPVLLNLAEMDLLWQMLGEFKLFQVGMVLTQGQGETTKEQFLDEYAKYLEQLKEGQIPSTRFFALICSITETAIKRQNLHEGKEIIRPVLPVIQIQPHQLQIDKATMSCRSMVYGVDTIPWGLVFSYPHLFEDPVTHTILTVDDSFPNTALFQKLRRFIREYTRPTPFIFNGQKVNVPIRLGKQCFSWISHTPWLRQQGVEVEDVSITR